MALMNLQRSYVLEKVQWWINWYFWPDNMFLASIWQMPNARNIQTGDVWHCPTSPMPLLWGNWSFKRGVVPSLWVFDRENHIDESTLLLNHNLLLKISFCHTVLEKSILIEKNWGISFDKIKANAYNSLMRDSLAVEK